WPCVHVALSCLSSLQSQRLFLLGFFAANLFAGIANALALVGLRRPICANVRCHLDDQLLVDALNQDFSQTRGLGRNTFRHLVRNRVRETERQVQYLACRLCTVTDANQLKLLLIAFGYALYHVVDDRACGTRLGPCLLRLLRRTHAQLTVFLGYRHQLVQLQLQTALAAFHGQRLAVSLDFHTARQFYRAFRYSRHICTLPFYQDTSPISSPPTLAWRAARSVMMPWLVDTTMMPKPPWTVGISPAAL